MIFHLCIYMSDMLYRLIIFCQTYIYKIAVEMTQAEATQWFEFILESDVQAIDKLIQTRPEVIQWRDQPLLNTAVFVVVEKMEEEEGLRIVEVMAGRGADVNAINNMGQTPLFYAIAQNKAKICRFLLQKGANLDIEDDFGQTPLQYASSLNRTGLVTLISQYKSHKTKAPFYYEPSSQSPHNQLIYPTIPIQTYHLCILTNSGQVRTIKATQLLQLQQKRSKILQMLRTNQLIPEQQLDMQTNWQLLGLKIIDKLFQLSDAYWFRHSSQIWRLPQKQSDNPGVDLSVMRLKLQHNIYQNPGEVRKDFNVMCQNVKKNVGNQHVLNKYCVALCNHFERMAQTWYFNEFIQRKNQKKS